MEKFKFFIIPIALFILTGYVIATLTPKIVDTGYSIKNVKADIETKTASVQEKEATLAEYERKEAEEKAKEKENLKDSQKPFFKAIETGLDTESVIAGEFSEILELIRDNKIKVRAIKYDYNPKDDNFVKGAGEKYNVARLNMEMIGNYTDYNTFLKELHKHEHFLDIESVEIVPYKKNKKILLINFKLKLYAKK